MKRKLFQKVLKGIIKLSFAIDYLRMLKRKERKLITIDLYPCVLTGKYECMSYHRNTNKCLACKG